jgi:hypothetical protein
MVAFFHLWRGVYLLMTNPTVINVGDAALAGSLGSSFVWVPLLQEINVLLTSVTLLIGLVLGVVRVIAVYRQWRRASGEAQ